MLAQGVAPTLQPFTTVSDVSRKSALSTFTVRIFLGGHKSVEHLTRFALNSNVSSHPTWELPDQGRMVCNEEWLEPLTKLNPKFLEFSAGDFGRPFPFICHRVLS